MKAVSLEIAKKLRDLGFSRNVYFFYKNGTLVEAFRPADFNRYSKEELISAPFYDAVREFLREEHGIFVDPYYGDGWSCKVYKGLLGEDEYVGFESYEECLEYVLNEEMNLI